MSFINEWSKERERSEPEWCIDSKAGAPLYEMTMQEIADELGITHNAAKSLYQRAIYKLRSRNRELEEWID